MEFGSKGQCPGILVYAVLVSIFLFLKVCNEPVHVTLLQTKSVYLHFFVFFSNRETGVLELAHPFAAIFSY